ncbi:MAG: hypothetical protein ACFFCQ_08570 [Promethearchaeota archaeon]
MENETKGDRALNTEEAEQMGVKGVEDFENWSKIEFPKFICKIHGITEAVVHLATETEHCTFCMQCLMKAMKEHFEPLERVYFRTEE